MGQVQAAEQVDHSRHGGVLLCQFVKRGQVLPNAQQPTDPGRRRIRHRRIQALTLQFHQEFRGINAAHRRHRGQHQAAAQVQQPSVDPLVQGICAVTTLKVGVVPGG